MPVVAKASPIFACDLEGLVLLLPTPPAEPAMRNAHTLKCVLENVFGVELHLPYWNEIRVSFPMSPSSQNLPKVRVETEEVETLDPRVLKICISSIDRLAGIYGFFEASVCVLAGAINELATTSKVAGAEIIYPPIVETMENGKQQIKLNFNFDLTNLPEIDFWHFRESLKSKFDKMTLIAESVRAKLGLEFSDAELAACPNPFEIDKQWLEKKLKIELQRLEQFKISSCRFLKSARLRPALPAC